MIPTRTCGVCALALLLLSAGVAAALPPDEAGAKAALEKSPRHGELVNVTIEGQDTPLKAYIVYPERKDKAPVVMVIHEIFGLTDWVRGVTDQLAAEGFIAIAPDLLSGVGGTDSMKSRDDAMKAVRNLKPETVMKSLDAVRDYALRLPAAKGSSATIGFCWGGGTSFAYAAYQPKLEGAVVYYGPPPQPAELAKIVAAVIGFYGGDDARITETVKPTGEAMQKLQKKYTPHVYDGAGHGFLRQQDGKGGANKAAAEKAWPATIAFLRETLEK